METGLSDKERLKRFFYTSSLTAKYVTGDPEKHQYYTQEKLKLLFSKILQSDNRELLLSVIDMVNSENLLPRRETIFVALAFAATSKEAAITDEFRHQIYTTLLNVCRSDEDLFTFIKLYSKTKKNFSSALNKAVFKYYIRKDPVELAQDVMRQPRYHGWTHKDVLKLAHGKCDTPLITLVICYVLFGLKKAKEFGANIPDSEKILSYLSTSQTLRRCELETQLPQLISEVKASITQVPSYYHKSRIVWEALIPHLDLKTVIVVLPLMFKYGFLKPNSPLQNIIVQALTDVERVKSSKVYPEEVFVGLRNFEKGGKPMDPQLKKHLQEKEVLPAKPESGEEKKKEVPKCPQLISALNKALQLSYSNMQPTGKRICITIEISEKMNNPCMRTKTVTCLEAALSMALGIMKTEKDVQMAVFNERRISPVFFEKNCPFNQALTKLKQAKHGCVYIPAVFDWAIKKNKKVDVFMNFLCYNHSLDLIPKEQRDKEKPVGALNRYRKKLNVPQAKMITFSLSSPNLQVTDGTANILDVCGFDVKIPKLVEAFCRGAFC